MKKTIIVYLCHVTYSNCFYHFITGVLYYVIYSYCLILPEVIAVYFNFNIDNCYARILQIVTYSISVWILLEDKNKLQITSVTYKPSQTASRTDHGNSK